jgi:hypothetical protein
MLTYELCWCGYMNPGDDPAQIYAHNLLVLRSGCEHEPLNVLNRYLEAKGIAHHYEMVDFHYAGPQGEALDILFVIHVYDDTQDIPIRLATDCLPLNPEWRRVFETRGEIIGHRHPAIGN